MNLVLTNKIVKILNTIISKECKLCTPSNYDSHLENYFNSSAIIYSENAGFFCQLFRTFSYLNIDLETLPSKLEKQENKIMPHVKEEVAFYNS